MGPDARDLLSLAAVLGQRFPVTLLQAASGMAHRELLSQLHGHVIAQFVAPDEETPDWYSFQHSLVVDALLSLLTPDRRAALAGRAAQAVEATYPGFPGEWCQAAATLRLQAGDPAGAGALFAEAGCRALHQGAASSAVTLLDKALELLPPDSDTQVRTDAFAAQLYALVEAGQVERAMSSAGELEKVTSMLDRPSRARVHTRLAWAAMVGGRSREGLAQVDIARTLLGPGAPDHDTAPVDIVKAHLTLDVPGPGQIEEAERLARRAATAAETAQRAGSCLPGMAVAGRAHEVAGPGGGDGLPGACPATRRAAPAADRGNPRAHQARQRRCPARREHRPARAGTSAGNPGWRGDHALSGRGEHGLAGDTAGGFRYRAEPP